MFTQDMMGNLTHPIKGVSRSISAENPTGAKGKGAMEGIEDRPCCEFVGKGWKSKPFELIEAGTTATLAEIDGPGMIQSMWFTGAIDLDLIIRIYWEDEENPAVEAPLVNFFLYPERRPGNKEILVNSMPICVLPNRGLNCYFQMPFNKKCRITVENRNDRETTKALFYQINYMLFDEPMKEISYFHAMYRRSAPCLDGVHTILDIKGNGHYVGTTMTYSLNGSSGWWGEGEIKFFMDGDEEYPTICGTGTEDYFGGSHNWDVGHKYIEHSTPFLGVPWVIKPDGVYESQMRFGLYRFHMLDPIVFKENLKIIIQDLGYVGDGSGRLLSRKDDITSVAYWYQSTPTEKYPELPSRFELYHT